MLIEKCSFCGKKLNEVKRMIQSPMDCNIYICDSCNEIAQEIIEDQAVLDLNEKGTGRKKIIKSHLPVNALNLTPRMIHKELDRFVIGQDNAKIALSLAVYNHSKRLKDSSGLIKKSNILLAGPSGCGKTLLAKTLANMLDVPFAIADATSLTEAGYVGDDVEVCLQKLLFAAGGDVRLAQKGIVYIDEIDKIAKKDESRNLGRDVSGEGVQSALLKIIEGCEVTVPINGKRKHPAEKTVTMDTTDILFIVGGAFSALFHKDEEIEYHHPLGFNAVAESKPVSKIKPALTQESLVEYGMMEELVGRLPVLVSLNELKEEDLVRILTEPEDAITKEYAELLRQDDIELIFEDEFLLEVAKKALEKGMGARGLRSILENCLTPLLYYLPELENVERVCITKETLESSENAVIDYKMNEDVISSG